MSFCYQQLVRKNIKGSLGVLSMMWMHGYLKSLNIQYQRISLALRLNSLRWKYLGFIVVCTTLNHASFFGNQWIEQQDNGLRVSGDNLQLSGLLKEWCHICQKQCVIDIDVKQKISLSIDHSDCQKLYQFLSQSISVDIVNDVYWFQNEPKGLWVTYSCQHRQPSELMQAIKSLLSPMGKYDHIYSDDATSTLWIPKRFYDNHQSLIESMDKPIEQYGLHLSWLRVTDALINQYHINDEDLWAWLTGQKRAIHVSQMMGWLQRYQHQGDVTMLSEMDVYLRSGETMKAKLSEHIPVERKDKKGNTYWKEALQGIDVEIKTSQIKGNQILLNIKLEDKNELIISKEVDISFQNSIAISKEDSVILSQFVQDKVSKQRKCHSLLSQFPFVGRLFCHHIKTYEKEKYLLVVSLV